MTSKLDTISIHLDWIRRGYTFFDILSNYEELTDKDPFRSSPLSDIQQHIGIPLSSDEVMISDSDYEKLC